MKTLSVGLGERTYNIYIGAGIIDEAGKYAADFAKRAAVVTDDNVWNLYGGRLAAALDMADISWSHITLPPGEGSKSISTLERVYDFFAESGLMRDSLVIAFGGGVVGDLSGFAAATYMRGVRYMQIPTTLLSQVDSSVGGKTAINLRAGKNLAGAFHQPVCVLSDTSLLSSLDERNFKCGMAEVIKHGILNKDFFDYLEQNPPIDDIVYRNCDIKRAVVERDERETGERAKLNLGHTFGHAIEKLGNFEKYNHGEAVAAGMLAAANVGQKLNITSPSAVQRIKEVLARHGLCDDYGISTRTLYPLMISDKKNEEGAVKLILIRDIGDVIIYKIGLNDFKNLMED